ncbi:MAG: NADP oxidoreductase, partial [Betaproteobacteria bacterium]|nr:NADP oxidoreductase [Betaproteobacteria bacterium]
VGLGNVAMDVVRILGSSCQALASTDIAPYALEALRESRVKTIYLLGRRGPAQAAFTSPEIQELGELEEADMVVAREELELDPASRAQVAEQTKDSTLKKNLETLAKFSQRDPGGRPKRIVLRFLVSPVSLHGSDRVQSMTLMRNRLEPDGRGGLKALATGQTEKIPVGLVFRSVGYQSVALPGLPFDERAAVIPNAAGRVLASAGAAETVPGVYVVGWVKRGPTGLIGTNKADAYESVDLLLEDLWNGKLPAPEEPAREAVERLLRERGVDIVTYEDWRALDRIEQARGKELGRPRVKFCRVEEMLAALRK